MPPLEPTDSHLRAMQQRTRRPSRPQAHPQPPDSDSEQPSPSGNHPSQLGVSHNQEQMHLVQGQKMQGLQGPEQSLRDRHNEDANDSIESIDFLLDPRNEMTLGRRIGLILKIFPWYFPGAKDRDPQDSFRQKEQTERYMTENFNTAHPGAIGAYPFTSSREEKPSLSQAWVCKSSVTVSTLY